MAEKLPRNPDLSQLKKRAKALLRNKNAALEQALKRIRISFPKLSGKSSAEILGAKFGLQDAQLVIAREYGFQSWAKLQAHVKSMTDPEWVAGESSRAIRNTGRIADYETLRTEIEKGEYTQHDLDLALTVVMRMEGKKEAEARACAELLIEHGADPDAGSDSDEDFGENYGPILLGPCEFHNPIAIRFLLEHGASPNADFERETKFPEHNTPLRMLLGTYERKNNAGKQEAIDTLLEYGAVVPPEVLPPFFAIHRGDTDDLHSFINENPAIVHERYPDMPWGNIPVKGGTLLHMAVEFNELDCVKLLLEHGADLEARSVTEEIVDGPTPFFHSIFSNQGGSFETSQYLLGKADLAERATFERNRKAYFENVTPLEYALTCKEFGLFAGRNEEEINLLREHGAVEPPAEEISEHVQRLKRG